MSVETAVRTLVKGQFVTEVDTPEGPWYEVVEVRSDSLVLQSPDEDVVVSLHITIPAPPDSTVLMVPTLPVPVDA